MKKIIIYTFSFLAIVGCKKIESGLENTINTEPIYKIKGSINNEAFNFVLDHEKVFMNYGESTTNGIATYYTSFENTESSKSIKLSIIAPEKIYKNLTEYPRNNQELPFLVHKSGCYNLGYSENVPNPPLIMLNQNPDQNGQFENKETIELEGFGLYDIPIRFKGLSNETFSFKINHGFTSSTWHAKFNIATVSEGVRYSSQLNTNKHEWFLDGTSIGNNSSGVIKTDASHDGVHTLHHIVTDDFGNKCSSSDLFYVFSNEVKWVFETNNCTGSEPESNFQNIIISYTDNGELYSSAFSTENINSFLSIENIEYFIENPNSTAISVKFDANFSGTLHNADKSKKVELSNITSTCKYIIK